MRNPFLPGLAILILMACNNENKLNHHIGYEEAAGFIEHPSLSEEQYHSGSLSVKVSPSQIYGLTYKRRLGSVSTGTIKKIQLSAWLRSNNEKASAKLVCAIDGNGQTLVWNAIDSKENNLSPAQWTEVKASFDIAKAGQHENTLVIYLLNTGEGSMWVDDITFNIE